MRRFLKYELDKYLDGRGGELVEEMPLVRVENQPYVHYRKGSVVMYALRDALGEEAVNRALARYVEQTAFQQPPYTVSSELVELLRAAAAEPWQQALLTDSLEHITVYSNEVTAATATTLASGRSAVEVTVRARKVRADGQGVETEVPLDDWVDVGVFADDDAVEVLALEKRHITAPETTFRFEVSGTPLRAGVDPYCKLVDRDSNDNLRRVTAASAATQVTRLGE
jgi:aminopeptidase N